MRSIVLTGSQFEIAFQVTYQATNFDELRLRELGVAADDLERLIAALRSVRAKVDCAARVRIDFQEPIIGSDRDVAGKPMACHGGDPGGEVLITLPAAWAGRWLLLAELVTSGLGRREFFLRTGYEWHEMEGVVRRLERVD